MKKHVSKCVKKCYRAPDTDYCQGCGRAIVEIIEAGKKAMSDSDLKYSDFMIDIETFGTGARAPVIQIGCVGFNRYQLPMNPQSYRHTLLVNCAPDLSDKNYEPDYDTISWWLQQSEEARTSITSGIKISLKDALLHLSNFIEVNSEDEFNVWAKPSSFDLVILEHAYKCSNLSIPWNFRSLRDVRTLIDVSGLSRREEFKPDIAHDALEDAIAQARTIQKAMSLLRP